MAKNTCKICNQECKSIASLSKHIRDKHEMTSREYYDLYIKSDNEGSCKICGNETRYVNFGDGYKNTCSHKCGAIIYRRILKNDPEKFKKFSDKVAKNQKRIWLDREKNGSNIDIYI